MFSFCSDFQERTNTVSNLEMAIMQKDPSLHFKVNIGLPYLKPSRGEEYSQRKQQLKEKRTNSLSLEDKNIPVDQIKQEWFKTSGPFHLKRVAEHFNVFDDLFGEAYFVPRIPLQITYPQHDNTVMPVHYGNQIKPHEV